MKTLYIIKLFLISTILINCKSAFINTSKNIKFGGANDSINLYAFVGEKISVIAFDPNENSNNIIEYEIDEETGDYIKTVHKKHVMDNAFLCKYKIIKKLFNYLPNDTVEFVAYDHYGKPGFSERDSVILYLSQNKETGKLYQRKYQYDNLFKDKNGNLYSYAKFLKNEDVKYGIEYLKGFKIDLANEKFNLTNLNNDIIAIYYPKQFYKIEEKYATPIKGFFLYEIINYRLNTTFKDL